MVKVIQKSFYIALFLAGILVPVANAYADGNTTDFSITVNPSLSLSVSSSTVGFEITPTQTGTYNSSSFNVYSSTNNVTGYTLTMSTSKVNLESNTVNPNTGTNPTIPTLTETQDGITAAAFEASASSDILNHYGVSIAGANYNAMKSTREIKKTTENNTTQDTTTIALASKLDLLTVPGVYSTMINFQLVANITRDSINDDGKYPANSLLRAYEIAYTKAGKPMYVEDSTVTSPIPGWRPMTDADQPTIGGKEVRFAIQDIDMTFEEDNQTKSVCEWARASVADNSYIDEALVMDVRDGKSYWIAKLADGRCWMTQNLDFDIPATALSSDTTDLTEYNTGGYVLAAGYSTADNKIYWTPSTATINQLSSSDDFGLDLYNKDIISFNPGDWYWTDTWFESSTVCPNVGSGGCNYLIGDENGKFKQTTYSGNGTHGHVGNYYNWSAAIASNDNSLFTQYQPAYYPHNSICPANWRLPNAMYNNATETYIADIDTLLSAYSLSSATDDVALNASPLYFVRSGDIWYGDLYAAGWTGNYWTGMNFNTAAGAISFSSSSLEPYTGKIKKEGFSIRCLAR